MTTDLWMLALSAALCLLIPFVHLTASAMAEGGMAWGFGNRDTPFPLPAWAERAKRAHANTIENLAPFAVFVLVAHASGKANETTALGAQLFLYARVAYVAVYTAGIPYLRTAVFAVATGGSLLVFSQLF